ncbi:amidohydrolase [Camelimonas abortus]|uniref:Amidohydrolase n=1 Tax=Camelimonas abortus TaxID=1017184 RepID=A0ABV7LBQ1_9HYPH
MPLSSVAHSVAARASARALFLAAAVALGAVPAAAPALAAPPRELAVKADGLIENDAARLTAIYKDLHQHPELAFEEKRTAGVVARELKALGYDVREGVGGTGVVAILRNGPGPVVMYRADMDANAVKEETGLPYASKVRVKRGDGVEVPVAHMCGHDAHVTWMLGMAKAMAELKAEWSGTLVLVAQPAEETIAGAKAMVADGLYGKDGAPKPDYLVGLHAAPVPLGVVANAPGPRMAGTDQIDVTFRGVGGHGSMPQLARDPVVMAAQAVLGYQTVVSRMIDPQDTAVITVGSVQAGADNNVIPDSASLKLNLRWYRPEVREQLLKGVRAVNEGVTATYGPPGADAPALVMKGGSTPLVNDPKLAARLAESLRATLGDKAVLTDFPRATGSEDFHLLLGDHRDVPVNYAFVGVADPGVFTRAAREGRKLPYANHSPNFVVDLKAIPFGARVATLTVLELLARPAGQR